MITPARVYGTVRAASGIHVDIAGLGGLAPVGARVSLPGTVAEVVAVTGRTCRAIPFAGIHGIGAGCRAELPWRPGKPAARQALAPTESWLGRVLDPLGAPIDGRGALRAGKRPAPVLRLPPPATLRGRLGPALDTGVTAMNLFAPLRLGQRLGLFAAAGVGKSTLLAMLARNAAADVIVIALIGERGREVREFLEDDLGPDALRRSVAVVATADSSPLLRREAALAATAIAEHFRAEGRSVLLLMDSVTRFCMALREIGLAAGEPPTTKGYPPSTFAALPRLLERAGPGLEGEGTITAIYTVLVEGDDHDEPVADAARGFLDGHLVLDRSIAERGRYPAIDVLRSLSRTEGSAYDAAGRALIRRARGILATHAELVDLIRLDAFRPGRDKAADEAVALAPAIERLITQDRHARTKAADDLAALAAVLSEDAAHAA